jgi:hypothetical protein
MQRFLIVKRSFLILLVLLLIVFPVRGSNSDPSNELEQIRTYSRLYEFDYVSWTVSALGRKLGQAGINVERYLSDVEKRDLVLEYLAMINQTNQLESELNNLLADPGKNDQVEQIGELRKTLSILIEKRNNLAPFVEQILQDQINSALVDLDMSLGGQLIPPVLYRSEPNSKALIVSPRDEISQAANLMLIRGLELDQIIALEKAIEENLDLSALVVGVGGVGLYPSMIIESANLDWLVHVISHEWTHNYLTIRPLGASYYSSPELTTINETIADLSADDIQKRVFQLYYPEYLEPGPVFDNAVQQELDAEIPPEDIPPDEEKVFDFREQMHITRLEVDRLLSEGRIVEAENYMENRRIYFLENGYFIRKLNQAYFAFHGSYAADPGGAANQEGADLGALLREIKSNTSSYKDFMQKVAWKWRLDQFERLFETTR